MSHGSPELQSEEVEESVQSKIDRETKRLTTDILRHRLGNRTDTALGLSILALATIQKDTSKAQALLDLIRDLDL
jgi:hypothetical protein